jgi:trans-aconitate methyltransferase
MKPDPQRNQWSGAEAYDPYVGRWSRLVAGEFLGWLKAEPGGRWLDVGCGTGALSRTILDTQAPAALTGLDASPAYIAYAREHVRDSRATFEVGDAQALSTPGNSFDMAVSGLVLNFVPEPEMMAAQMAASLAPGGTAAVYVWDYAGGMQLMRHFWNAAAALDPAAAALDEGRRFRVCQPDELSRLFQSAGLDTVETRAIDIPTDFRDFDDFWSPFLGGQGPAPAYCVSLGDEQRAALRERLRASLPVALDGSIPLHARAWAVRGRRSA